MAKNDKQTNIAVKFIGIGTFLLEIGGCSVLGR
jgi:hypothetical protein